MSKKICSCCKRSLELFNFYKNKSKKDGLQIYCKMCFNKKVKHSRKTSNKLIYKKRQSKYRKLIILAIAKYKNNIGCCYCHEKDDSCLDFHHIDPSSKHKSVSHLSAARNIDKLIIEIKKCVILCANCHRKLHQSKISINNIPPCSINKNCLNNLIKTSKIELEQKFKNDVLCIKKDIKKYKIFQTYTVEQINTILKNHTIIDTAHLLKTTPSTLYNLINKKILLPCVYKKQVYKIRPDKQTLLEQIKLLSKTEIAKKYKVAHYTVCRWYKYYNLNV